MNHQNNSSFSTQAENLQIAWDSTSLGLLKECPRKYQYAILLGRVSKDENVHLSFGQMYHKALETYDHHRSMGKSYEEAVREAIRYCLIATRVETPTGWRPWDLGHEVKTRFGLIQTVAWYLFHFEIDPCVTIQLANGKPAVELSFRYETEFQAYTGESFLSCGHLDRLVTFNGEPYILDRKTTKNTLYPEFFDNFNPDNQMSTYDLAGVIVWKQPIKGIIIDAAQVAVTFSRFLRGFTLRTDEQRKEFYADLGYWFGQAEMFAHKGYWPKNDKSCGNYGGCVYRRVCSLSPAARQGWLEQAYSPRIWDPLQVRGDI